MSVGLVIIADATALLVALLSHMLGLGFFHALLVGLGLGSAMPVVIAGVQFYRFNHQLL